MERRGQPLSWMDSRNLLTNALSDIAQNVLQLTQEMDALRFGHFEGKGCINLSCKKIPLGTRRPDDDHVKRLIELLPKHLCAILHVKVDLTKFVHLMDVLRVLRTSRFGLKRASYVAKGKKKMFPGLLAGWGRGNYGHWDQQLRGEFSNYNKADRPWFNNNQHSWQRQNQNGAGRGGISASGPGTPGGRDHPRPTGTSNRDHKRGRLDNNNRCNQVHTPMLCDPKACLQQGRRWTRWTCCKRASRSHNMGVCT